MKIEHIEHIRNNKRLYLTLEQKLSHYRPAFFPLLLAGLLAFVYVTEGNLFFFNIYGAELWLCIILSFFFYIKQFNKLKLTEYAGELTDSDVKTALERSLKQLDGSIKHEEKKIFQAVINNPLNMNDNDLLTILINEKSFIVNSIAFPSWFSLKISAGRNKQNVRIFLKHLRDVLDGNPENLEYLVPEKEWTIKKNITRLILYPFFIFVIIMSFFLISDPIHARSIPAGFFGLIIGIGYIVIDIILITKK